MYEYESSGQARCNISTLAVITSDISAHPLLPNSIPTASRLFHLHTFTKSKQSRYIVPSNQAKERSLAGPALRDIPPSKVRTKDSRKKQQRARQKSPCRIHISAPLPQAEEDGAAAEQQWCRPPDDDDATTFTSIIYYLTLSVDC
eukprot:scaffold832_cov256-Skeletonema_marinoi.AAC.2